MKSTFIILFSLCYSPTLIASSKYSEIFGDDYANALRYVERNEKILTLQLKEYKADAQILIPVIFPELVRYNLLRDKMESTGLSVFYANFGKDYANFSIGYFQMKPSFVENLEGYFRERPHSVCSVCARYAGQNEDDRVLRRQRVWRLETLSWQLMYLACFAHAVQIRFRSEMHRLNKAEKIRFFASAYNAGFESDLATILRSGKQNWFPYGKMLMAKNYNYSEIAVDFYENFWKYHN